MDTTALVRWLIDGAGGLNSSPAILGHVCDELSAAGVPLAHAEAFVRTLHPNVVGRRFVWEAGKPVEVREATWAYLQSAEFVASPVGEVFATSSEVRRGVDGFTDFFAAPLSFLSGETHAISLATRAPGGFSADAIVAIRSIVSPLSRIAEILALSRTAANLLNTYVGRGAGEKILAGKIQRGDVDSIRAVLWFSDLRGFTEMANELEPVRLIRVLNDLFECQVPAIEKHGGEVLKFMGDGLLGIFPIDAGDRNARERCDGALDAAASAFADLARLNVRRESAGDFPLRMGLALHIGDIAYGNIGSAGRLDFTCIGPAVNLASRLEGVASKVGEQIVVSQEFRSQTDRPMRSLGEFTLKGVPGPQTAWAPAE